MSQRPLVVVLGATACGKSRLAIELARKFKGEIISADSMQVYRGLDIVTNKVTDEEQQLAKHHMINFLDPLTRYSVVDFRNKSLRVIDSLHEQNKLPVVVGGTNYYIESLLWKGFLIEPTAESAKRTLDIKSREKTLIDTEAESLHNLTQGSLHTDDDLEDVDKFFSKPIYNDAFKHIDSKKLWSILEKVDAKAAHLYHPHDKRRLIRSLQIIQDNRQNYSQVLEDVNKSGEETNKASLGGPLRFQPTCVLWLHCDYNILDKILDDRVDQMLNRGLLAELEQFHEDYNKSRISEGKRPDYDKGVFQTIGFKEFHEYFMLDQSVKETDEGNQILRRSIEEMKMNTRRYARRQLKWIRRRFLQSGTRDLPLLFKLTTSFDEETWTSQVQKSAFDIVDQFLRDCQFSDELLALKQEPERQELVNSPGKYDCEVCERVFIGSHFIESHLKSKVHQRNLRRVQSKKQRLGVDEMRDNHPEGVA